MIRKALGYLFIGVILLLTMSCGISRRRLITDKEKLYEFNKIESSFQNVNSIVLDLVETYDGDKGFSGKRGETIFTLEHKNDSIVGIKDVNGEYLEEIIGDLIKINDYMMNDFDFIVYTDNRISYEGDGNHMVIYSMNGEVPDYYFYKGDRTSFTVYDLNNQWFLLVSDIR